MKDDEGPSPWGGVLLVMLGVAMILFPIVALFTGVAIFAGGACQPRHLGIGFIFSLWPVNYLGRGC